MISSNQFHMTDADDIFVETDADVSHTKTRQPNKTFARIHSTNEIRRHLEQHFKNKNL